MTSPSSDNFTYILGHGASEPPRLNAQHEGVKACFSNHLIHPSIPIPQHAKLADNATGTAIVLLDLARTRPDVFETLTGFDLTSAKFPPAAEFEGLGDGPKVELLECNVLDGFPEDRKGKYDVVLQRFLCLGLKAEDWPKAVKSLSVLPKPGGWIQLVEAQPWFVEPTDLSNPDIQLGNKWCKSACEVLGVNIAAALNLKELLAGASFTNEWTVDWPLGPYASSNPSLPPSFGETSIQILFDAFDGVVRGLHEKGLLEKGPEGLRTMKEYEGWKERVWKFLREKGGNRRLTMCIGRKQ
ncbi:putative LaeA-like methyltransferase [Pseudohyphozyma bogoriensis]|nr:putative LaeA-like methyltransferase [Pseudohyphozyma bogoriensis]